VVGTLAFRLDSATSLFEIWMGLYALLSGYLVPLELFPPWVTALARWLPFRSMLGFPVELVTGMLTRQQALAELAIQWGWIAGLLLLVRHAWRVGLRRFAAFGG
jgi:ABC-2 type transport system permease protein